MTNQFLTSALYTIMCLAGFVFLSKGENKTKIEKPIPMLAAVLLAAFGLRRFYGLQDVAFWFDVDCFKSWADATAYYGLDGMYHSGQFLDYPPGYMYILWLTNWLQYIFNLDFHSVVYTFIIKLPAMLADLAGAVFIYKVAKDRLDEKWALFLATVYVFNPGLVFNSSIWGQIDSYYTLLMVLSLYFISKDDAVKAAMVYALALITKPQALLFGPVLLFWVISKKDRKVFFKAVGTGIICLWLLALPFSQSLSPLWLINLYKNTFNGYRYFTVNGYNLYMIFDLNWHSLDSVPGAEIINIIVILIGFIFCGWLYFKQQGSGKIFSTALVFICVFFSFCTMMHERYMHPALILALLSFIYTQKKGWFAVFLGAAAANYLNVAASMYSQYSGVYISVLTYKFISLLAVGTAVFAIYQAYSAAHRGIEIKFAPLSKEAMAIGGLCAVYALFAFFRLGSTAAPQTFYQSRQAGDWFVYRFDQTSYVDEIWSFSGMGDQYYPAGSTDIKKGCEFEILVQNEDGLWGNMADLHHDYVFTWEKIETGFVADAIMIRAKEPGQVLGEIVLRNQYDELIYGTVDSGSEFIFQEYSPYNALDESHMLPKTGDDYYWSMYFDEIYHGRTAFEQLNSYTIYETTHPPLGKILISIGIALFGMSPFGWRVMGALAGVLMVWIMYLLAKELFGNIKTAWFTAFIFAFDFMHFTQTRIATVDSFLVLFIMLMFLFMVRYAKIPLDKSVYSQMFNLLLSGIFMGCAVAVKWNGAYSAVGLALYFFYALIIKYKDYIINNDSKTGLKKSAATCGWCVLCFAIVPAMVYFASFAPVLYTDGIQQTVRTFINKQVHMFNYHSTLVADHFFSSPWYTWPVITKPIWYSVARYGDKVSSISAFGNPAVWLPMIPALVYTGVKGVKRKDRNVPLIPLGYLASFLPWMAVSRLAFIYHYFPATVFGTLAIGYVINDVLKKPKAEKWIWIYPAVVFALFMIFFPVISGLPASASYIDSLELLDTWYFN